MSAVLGAIESKHATARIERLTQELTGRRTDVRWRYDLLDSQFSPAQYYAVALRGSGADAEELLVIAIECFVRKNEGGPFLVVSGSITTADGALLAEADDSVIPISSAEELHRHPDRAVAIAKEVQAAFDEKVDWVNEQRVLIDRILQQATV